MTPLAEDGHPRRPAVFLDRDGVLSVPVFRYGRSYAVRRLDAFRLYPDAAGSVAALKEAGFLVVVATNQPDVGAGLVERATVEAMHERLKALAPVDDIEVCYETREQATPRRKPGPGMLLSAAEKWGIELGRSFMVGDRASDVECALRAGCTAVFVDRGYREAAPSGQAVTVASLAEAVQWIVRQGAVSGRPRARTDAIGRGIG